MMKKLTALISTLALLLTLCACSGTGGTQNESVAPDPGEASQAVSEQPTQDIQPSGESEPPDSPAVETETLEPSEGIEPSDAVPETAAPTPAADLKAIAISLIDHPVSELYAAIGQPITSDYAPGCVEPNSEDGELIYDGFTVYTVRTSTQEYVYDVL